VQSESAVRPVGNENACPGGKLDELTLRGGSDVVGVALRHELNERLDHAGIHVGKRARPTSCTRRR